MLSPDNNNNNKTNGGVSKQLKFGIEAILGGHETGKYENPNSKIYQIPRQLSWLMDRRHYWPFNKIIKDNINWVTSFWFGIGNFDWIL